jgi:hypothetical protein
MAVPPQRRRSSPDGWPPDGDRHLRAPLPPATPEEEAAASLPSRIDEHQPPGIELALATPPAPAHDDHVRAILLGRVQGFL